eukprot:1184663-Prorocentrum_minimum.AAC.1
MSSYSLKKVRQCRSTCMFTQVQFYLGLLRFTYHTRVPQLHQGRGHLHQRIHPRVEHLNRTVNATTPRTVNTTRTYVTHAHPQQKRDVLNRGYDADVKDYDADVEGYDADVKGYDADVKGYDADVKGYDAD